MMLCVPTSVGVLVRVARPVRDETVLPSDAIASASAAAAAAGLLNLSEIVARNLSPSPSAIAAARHAAAGTPAAAPSTSDAAPQPSRSGEQSARRRRRPPAPPQTTPSAPAPGLHRRRYTNPGSVVQPPAVTARYRHGRCRTCFVPSSCSSRSRSPKATPPAASSPRDPTLGPRPPRGLARRRRRRLRLARLLAPARAHRPPARRPRCVCGQQRARIRRRRRLVPAARCTHPPGDCRRPVATVPATVSSLLPLEQRWQRRRRRRRRHHLRRVVRLTTRLVAVLPSLVTRRVVVVAAALALPVLVLLVPQVQSLPRQLRHRRAPASAPCPVPRVRPPATPASCRAPARARAARSASPPSRPTSCRAAPTRRACRSTRPAR